MEPEMMHEAQPEGEAPAAKALEAVGSDAVVDRPATASGIEEILPPATSDAVAVPDVQAESKAEPVQATIRLEKKHPLAVRWMHWINFPVLFTMIWSGLLIYWNDSDNAYQHPHAVYRIGLGSFTLFRFFPDWFYTNRLWDVRYHVTEGLGYHFFFLWLFAINGICYVLYLIVSGEWRYLLPTKGSWREALEVTLYDLGLRKEHPPERKFNSAQKIAYTAIVLMGAGSLVTGLAIYKPTQAHWVTTLLGGYEMARWEHFWLTIGFCGFFVVHVGQVVRAGWNNFRSMVSGWEVRPAEASPYQDERRDA